MFVDELRFDDQGLIPAVICDHETSEVLMVGYMNEQAVLATVESGRATFYSRSRGKMWVKGESSGHVQDVRWIRTDCDADTLLVGVEQTGGACHEGYRSCFFRELRDGQWQVVADRCFNPETVYPEKTE
ncbi:MAG TPA: phosphoribosyl-AMP cyclohydrolase [Armatimonadota bacterium]|nr:phosphoribosyl-AMP cyclohydrolase [Armatimonadota bacterium]